MTTPLEKGRSVKHKGIGSSAQGYLTAAGAVGRRRSRSVSIAAEKTRPVTRFPVYSASEVWCRLLVIGSETFLNCHPKKLA
jgi:hypothetical protein